MFASLIVVLVRSSHLVLIGCSFSPPSVVLKDWAICGPGAMVYSECSKRSEVSEGGGFSEKSWLMRMKRVTAIFTFKKISQFGSVRIRAELVKIRSKDLGLYFR